MRDFTFHAPTTLREVYDLLERYGEDARLIAGGTALTVMMKQSLVPAEHLVSLHRLEGFSGIHVEDGALHIRALTPLREVETSATVREHVPLVAEVYGHVATVRIRNQATVGGGLAHGDPAQDPQPGLMVLDASVVLSSRDGQRQVSLSELYVDYYETSIQAGEVLTELVVPIPRGDVRTVYLRYTPRTADDYPTIAVAALAEVYEGDCREIKVALGAAAPTAIRAGAVESVLRGQRISGEAVAEAAALVAGIVDPLDDFRGSAEYKRDMAEVFTRRALEKVLGISP